MTDHLPNEHAERPRASVGWTGRTLLVEAAHLIEVERLIEARVHRLHRLVQTPGRAGFDADRSLVGYLYETADRLRGLSQLAWVSDEASSSNPSTREDVTRLLLRTAEEASVIPCGTSGLLHGLDPTPVAHPLVIIDELHLYSPLPSVLHRATGSGKTATVVFDWVDRLNQRVGCLSRDGHDPTAELAHIADAAYALSVLLMDLAQHLLTGYVRPSGHLVAVPPNESSPCGILRLSVRRVPRAPGVDQVPDPTTFVLAA
ncbi:hypothetical protein [Streptomyces buecherae]|uniref:Uncharacterized protein n=1 Tax=Streptomyces buecherae TaxID=2763006 RepID=A0A7H8NCJ5_9ACTN|nr:hypothetical protein [Streptomyces buecherae]QKW51488.1 hypothetical protein HUT08_20315 [Streptomyces buecherae]